MAGARREVGKRTEISPICVGKGEEGVREQWVAQVCWDCIELRTCSLSAVCKSAGGGCEMGIGGLGGVFARLHAVFPDHFRR